MKRTILAAAIMLFLSTFALSAGGDRVVVKIGPVFEIGKYGELTDAELVGDVTPGLDVAVCFTERIEFCGSYRFNKTTTRIGHGSDDVFRVDAFAAGLRYKPLPAGRFQPFIGIGLDYYHFSDRCGEQDSFTYFVLPVNSAIGPYIQGGFYARALKPLQVLCFVTYNLVKHTGKYSTDYGTYHYRTDFSGLGFGTGILLCINGK